LDSASSGRERVKWKEKAAKMKGITNMGTRSVGGFRGRKWKKMFFAKKKV
jgi:hypothetical protein